MIQHAKALTTIVLTCLTHNLLLQQDYNIWIVSALEELEADININAR